MNAWCDTQLEAVTVNADTERREVALVAERLAAWHGRVLLPEGVPPESLMLHLAPDAPPLHGDFGQRSGLDLRLDGEGRFVADQLLAGRVEISLKIASGERSSLRSFSSSSSGRLALGALQLNAGELLEHDVDAAAEWPGSLSVRVLDGDKPLDDVVVQLWSVDSPRVVAGAQSDVHGYALLFGLAPGSYELRLRSTRDGWTWNTEQWVRIRRREVQPLTLACKLGRGVLELVDDTGAPLAGRDVALVRPPSPSTSVHTTDARGRLTLVMPVGEYLLNLGRNHDEARARPLNWTLDGPSTERLRFSNPEEPR